MENKNSFTIVGIFTVLVAILIVLFVGWMTLKSDKKIHYTTYYIYAKELPNGLKEGTTVKFMGLLAGYVKDVNFVKDSNYSTIEIVVDIQKDFPIKKDSIATIEIQGISGLIALNLTKGAGESFKNGEKPIIYLDDGLLAKFNKEAKNLSTKIDMTLKKVDLLLNESNLKNFSDILSSLNLLTSNLSSEKNLEKIDSILLNLDLNLKDLNSLIKSANKSALNLNQTLSLVNSAIKSDNYNLKEIISPTLDDVSLSLDEFKKLINELQNTLFRLEDNPYEFFFRDLQE